MCQDCERFLYCVCQKPGGAAKHALMQAIQSPVMQGTQGQTTGTDYAGTRRRADPFHWDLEKSRSAVLDDAAA